jgi:hypothetical protein
MQAVDEERQSVAETHLNHLIDFGILATQRNNRLQVPQEQLQPLLALSLGFQPESWDLDLVESLPQLPDPIDVDILTSVEVRDE